MEQFIMKGGNPLVGEVTIGGAKNAALGILAASIMTDEDVLIENLPDVRDINVLLEAIQEIGASVDRIDRHTVKINASDIHEVSVDDEYIRRIRGRFLANTKARRFRFLVAVTSEAVRSIFTLRDSALLAQR